MVKQGRKLWKEEYSIKLQEYLEKYDKCFLVGIDNVRSSQMHKIRYNLRGKAELLMGKNTLIRRVINQLTEKNPDLAKIMNHIRENVGFVFTNDDLKTIKDEICKNTVEAPAKAGAIAQRSVVLPKQQTTLGPEKTSFFQALAIPTKITRGTIEILNDVNLIQEGDKVGASEATLLGMLKIYPFTYGLLIKQVYDSGSIFEPAILDITTEDLLSRFMKGVRNIAAASLAIDHPTMASVPHSIANGFKKLLCVSVATDYTFKESEKLKEMLADPSKFVVAAPVAAAATSVVPAETKEEEPESDSDASMGMGLFD